MITFKFLIGFQKIKRYFNGNSIPSWGYSVLSTIDLDIITNIEMKSQFFKFINIDFTWNFEENKSYIFPIFWDDTQSNLLNELTMFLNENKSLFLNRTLIPVFLDPLEGNSHVGSNINQFVSYFNDIKFYHISADYKLTKINNKFKFCYIDMWQYHIIPSETGIDYFPKKDYINLNRRPHLHRCLLMQQLIDNYLLSNGYNTWALLNKEDINDPTMNNIDEIFKDFKIKYPNTTIENQTYDILDVVDLRNTNPIDIVPLSHCRESFIYIVTETHINNHSIFLTEKTYKPISIGMPFIILGNPGTLRYLRENGYITFSDWIDESYDMDLPLEDRIAIIIQNLIKISKMSDIQKINIRRQMNEICQHNLDLYKLLNRKNNFVETLKLIEKGMI